jgi:hypothetical protein
MVELLAKVDAEDTGIEGEGEVEGDVTAEDADIDTIVPTSGGEWGPVGGANSVVGAENMSSVQSMAGRQQRKRTGQRKRARHTAGKQAQDGNHKAAVS